MIFTELQFWAFFAIVFALYAVLPRKAQNRMRLIASYVFYGAWDWGFPGPIRPSAAIGPLATLRLGEEPGQDPPAPGAAT